MARKAKPKKNRVGLLNMPKGKRKISLKQSARKSAKSGYVAPKKRTGPNSGASTMATATSAGRKSSPKKARNDKLVVKNRKLNPAAKTMASATSKGRKGGAKPVRNDKLAVKNRKLNSSAKSMANATMAGKAPTKSKLSRFGQIKLAAKQKALNFKGQAKALGRKGGKMSAKHRKAISDGLKKRFGRG